MESNAVVLIGMAVLGVSCLVGFAIYRWRQRERVRQVETWVKDYLFIRYGELPNDVTINCTDDRLWPVLVAFDTPRTGIRHNLQFACAGRPSSWLLLLEKDELKCPQ